MAVDDFTPECMDDPELLRNLAARMSHNMVVQDRLNTIADHLEEGDDEDGRDCEGCMTTPLWWLFPTACVIAAAMIFPHSKDAAGFVFTVGFIAAYFMLFFT